MMLSKKKVLFETTLQNLTSPVLLEKAPREKKQNTKTKTTKKNPHPKNPPDCCKKPKPTLCQ